MYPYTARLRSIWRPCSLLSSSVAVTELVSLSSFGSRCYSADAATSERDTGLQGHAWHRARSLDGRAVAAHWQDELAREVSNMRAKGLRRPGLGVVLVGERPDSMVYVARKQEACSRVGIYSELCHLPANSSQQEVQDAITALCRSPSIDGVLVQLPLPRHIDEEAIIESFDPGKDVDGFHPLNIGRILMRGRAAHFVPCTALGCIQLLERSGVPIKGKSVVVMGDSNIVGMPLAMLFRDSGAATVTVIHRNSYRELFQDSYSYEQRALQRAQAEACLPRLPGLVSRHATASDGEGPPPQCQRPAEASQLAGGQHAHRPYKVTYASRMREVYSSPSEDSDDARRQQQHGIEAESHRQQQQQQHGGQHPPTEERWAADEGRAGAVVGVSEGGEGCMHVEDLPGITRTADILVVAVGFPQLVRAHWVKPGAVVLDVGINVVDWGEEQQAQEEEEEEEDSRHRHRNHDVARVRKAGSRRRGGRDECGAQREAHPEQQGQGDGGGGGAAAFHVVGDVDFCGVSECASAVTPVPGGVGPMTIAALMHNTVQAAKYTLGLARPQ